MCVKLTQQPPNHIVSLMTGREPLRTSENLSLVWGALYTQHFKQCCGDMNGTLCIKITIISLGMVFDIITDYI